MSILKLIWKSIRHHWLSSSLAVISIGLGTALFVSVISLREQAHANFTDVGIGIDAVLGPKGSPLQIVLNAVYHLEEMPGKIKWSYYKKVIADPIVEEAVPFCTGHSYAGYRVNAIDERFLEHFEYLPGKRFSFSEDKGGQGRMFQQRDEAVAGAVAAQALNFHIGSVFNPVCGVRSGDPVHENDHITIVGILAPTGTPHDRAIYIPLNTFYTLEGHGNDVANMAVDEDHREISGAYIKIRKIREGVVHPGLQGFQYNIAQSTSAQLVVPNEVLPRLFGIFGWVDRTLLGISFLVTILSGLFLFVALISALRERRRDIAILRALGATRQTVFSMVIVESTVIAILGGVLGLVTGHILVGMASSIIKVETGLQFSAWCLSTGDVWILPGVGLLGILSGIIPAIQTYRLGVLRNLTPLS